MNNQKIITLSSEQYDALIELVDEERSNIKFMLANVNSKVSVTEREELETEYEQLSSISTTMFEQCE